MVTKKVGNTKVWCDVGWLYHMTRMVDGKQYGVDLIISSYEMHARNYVAYRLHKARRELRAFRNDIRNLPEFT